MLSTTSKDSLGQPRPPRSRNEANPSPSYGLTNGQRAWIRLFDRSKTKSFHEVETATVPVQLAPVPADLPRVGGNHDFIEPLPWPQNICYVSNNVFIASKPFPCSENSTGYHYACGCEGGRCILDDGTRLTSGCANAAMELICDDTNCSVGVSCGNRFTPRFHLDLITTSVGIGAVCSSPIPKGAFVVEYVGELLLREDAMARRDRRYQVSLKTKAIWDGRTSVFIDAAECGNESRFINHSCSPNCELYEWEWANGARLGIFAATDIPPLQELTFRYRDKNLTLFDCQCGQQNCVTKQP